MKNYQKETLGDRLAEIYDQFTNDDELVDTDELVAYLFELVGTGRALELGVGTGRVAIPLASKGTRVSAVEISERMIEKFGEKPGSELVNVIYGDFVSAPYGGPYDLIYCPFNTFLEVTDAAEQLSCLGNIAKSLTPDGKFVLDCFVPDLTLFDRGQLTRTFYLSGDEVRIETAIHDPIAQRIESVYVYLSEDRVKLYPVEVRYIWPSELDAMARSVGLSLEGRFGGYDLSVFDAESKSHVSIFGVSP